METCVVEYFMIASKVFVVIIYIYFFIDIQLFLYYFITIFFLNGSILLNKLFQFYKMISKKKVSFFYFLIITFSYHYSDDIIETRDFMII